LARRCDRFDAANAVPSRDGNVDELFDQAIGAGMSLGVEVVDVTGKSDGPVLLEGKIGRKPLVLLGIERPWDLVPGIPLDITLLVWALLGRLDRLPLARPFVDGVLHADNLLLEEVGLS
jgi:hypothetical protein